MNLEIAPYVGVGPLRFGMTRSQAHELVGAPRARRRMKTELREVLATYDGGLTFEGPPGRRLLQDDPEPGELVGFLVFLRLGVTLSGFHEATTDEAAVTVFERGRWDSLAPRFQPFRAR
jgi:hypothetical protein